MRTSFILILISAAAMAQPLPPAAVSPVEFQRDVAPLLKRCHGCHGPRQQVSGLRLDRREDALKGGYSGVVIRPGDGAGSKLIHMVAGTKTEQNRHALAMPPAGPRLSAEEIGVLRAWIDGGARYPEAASEPRAAAAVKPTLWSLRPVRRPEVPEVRNRAWVRNSVDAFILARLEAKNIQPSPEADRATLIRRISLDITGLPPPPDEVEAFVPGQSPGDYEKAVDRLLNSPHFGEKWARHWLDQARYADSDGHENDRIRPHAWRYRQWVIDAFNRDLPFDQFVVHQIAGDLSPGGGLEQKIATGFHRNSLSNREAGTALEQVRFEQLVDRTNAFGTAFLGLTLGCAQCHDHKYDPLSQRDYYQLAAFFHRAEDRDIDAPLPGELGPWLRGRAEHLRRRRELLQQYKVPELQPEWERRLLEAAEQPGRWTDWDHHYSRVTLWVDNGDKILRTAPARRSEKHAWDLTRFFIAQSGEVTSKQRYQELKFKELLAKLDKLEEAYPSLSQAQVIVEAQPPPKTHIHLRGEYDAPGVEVEPDVPAALLPLPEGERRDRLGLARWLVSREHPLTARVAVNRLWQELFGRGIVPTSEDFGAQGEPPTHPELLDWLAAEFREGGWSVKRLLKLMIMSSTYRQSSRVRPGLENADPENALLARQARLRLPAELIRDAALTAGGLLDRTVGGGSVRPPQPAGVTSTLYNSALAWRESPGRERYRRGLYVHFQRSLPYPTLINFDAPNSNVSSCRRARSNTPLQALNLLNDPVFFEAGQGLAVRILTERPSAIFHERLLHAYRICLARPPGARESERLLASFQHLKSLYEKNPAAAKEVFPAELENVDRVEAAAWTGLATVLLNVDEFITRE